jgi:V8-like Glu-specific endopeptidase
MNATRINMKWTAAVMLAATMSVATHAQVSEMMIFDTLPADISSGVRHAPVGQLLTDDEQIIRTQMFSTLVHEPRANMMRLHFSDFDLGRNSKIRITSLADGAVQWFSHDMLHEWGGWSAIFNGNSVVVELLVAPGEDAFFEITEIAVNDPPEVLIEGDITLTLCDGTDSRVSSSDSRVGRLSGPNCGAGGGCGGCTAWLASTGAAISAGHCGTGSGGLIEFNVPQSNANGTPVAAHPNNQYPVGVTWYASQNGGVGFDWAIMSVGPNANTGQRAHWVQNHFHLSPNLPSNGVTIRITGYGIDNTPLGTQPGVCCGWTNGLCSTWGCNSSSLTLQTSTGPKDTHTTNQLFYRADTMGANSGSPIIWNANSYAIGVHTHGGCTSSGGSNSGTRLTQSTFSTWLNNFLDNATFVNTANHAGIPIGNALYPATTFTQGVGFAPSGGDVAIAKGNYSDTGVFNKNVTVRAVSGVVTIGN